MRDLLEFENTLDLIEYAKKHSGGSMWEKTNKKDFYGCRNNKEAIELGQYGWHDGLQDVYGRKLQLKTKSTSTNSIYSYDVIGDVLDVGTYLTGEPECWLQQTQIEGKPQLDIIVNISIAAGVEKETVINRGAVIVSLIDHLSKDYNLSVKVYAGSKGYAFGNNKAINLLIKLGNSPLDLDGVAFAVAHPAYFRYLCTAAIDNYYDMKAIGTWRPIDYERENTKDLIYFPSINHQENSKYKTIKACQKWLNETIKKYERA